MKKLATLFLLLFMNSFCFSQYDASPKQIDSLINILNNTPETTERTPVLTNLWRAYIQRDSDKAFGYAQQLIDLGKKLNDVPTTYTGYQRMAIAYSYTDDLENSNKYYRKGLKLSTEHKEHSCIAAMHLNLSLNHAIINRHDSTLYHATKAEKHFLIAHDTTGYAGALEKKAIVYNDLGQFKLALENNLKAMRIYEQYSDDRAIRSTISAMNAIGYNYLKMKDTLMAINYYEKALNKYKERDDKLGVIFGLTQLGVLNLSNKAHYNTSKTMLLEAKDLAISMKSPGRLSMVYYGLGLYYKKGKIYKEANKYFNQSLKISDSLQETARVTNNQIQMAEIAFIENNYNKSIRLSEKALALAKQKNLLETQLNTYNLLFKNYEKLNQTNKAFSYHKLYKKINDSIYNIENGQKLSELQTIYETEKKEAEIAFQQKEIETLNQKIEIGNLKKGLYAGGMFTFLAVSSLLYFGFKQRIKKNKIERKKQEEIYKQEIAFKKKELASQTLHLVQKNTFIQELKENLEKIKKSPELFKVEFRRLVMLLKKESAEDKDWEIFKSYFTEVHNNFDNKLKAIYADITEKEIRLASFLRMNLSTKEIASMLNVLPESVLKSKYRLKKKLNLNKETDLGSFLNGL
ncbi:tetratricopeptide repeat protein [Seonamhaeicola algicola]|uniref:Tetratricopeptide repeat protein n=1 Tax=Seonamhaeicola algicola TaxID=1719036 RepID=A0A5C7B5C6_9FLAO|nr:tetratricopeptide repeat protein [Seonamhaeicola algicola]TXE15113.1 tetratricopeptide repeat protein [Seonamhaeicola algicola]